MVEMAVHTRTNLSNREFVVTLNRFGVILVHDPVYDIPPIEFNRIVQFVPSTLPNKLMFCGPVMLFTDTIPISVGLMNNGRSIRIQGPA